MQKNVNLGKAKSTQNDEFYTQYKDISNEISHYRRYFTGAVVYCNCDDPSWSNFWRYFHNNFTSLGLKKLISTHYRIDSEPSYAMIYTGGDDFNMEAGKIIVIHGNDNYTAGDFRSNDCIKFLKEADIVVTNPPFSIAREYYIPQLFEYKKNLLLLATLIG